MRGILSHKRVKSQLKFDAQRAYHHIAQLAFPRAVGSTGESKARTYIVEQLSRFGLHVDEEAFQFTLFPAEFLPRLVSAVFTVAVIIVCWIVTSHPIYASLLCMSLLLISLALTRWKRSLEWLYNVGKMHASTNIIGRTNTSSEAILDLIFIAHYDSKSQILPIAVRALCYCVAVVGMIGLTLLTILQIPFHNRLPSLLIWGVGGCICLCLTLLQFNFTQNRSPGAFDNASGVGVLLELAQSLIKSKSADTEFSHANIRLTFLSPGAEEYGMCGALRWIQRHAHEYHPDRTYVINLDGVGATGKITLITRYGLPPLVTSKRLGRRIRECGAEIGIDVSEIYSPAGVGYDGIPIASRGFETVTLSAGGFGGATMKIHSKRDGIDLIDQDSLQRVGDLIVHFVNVLNPRKAI